MSGSRKNWPSHHFWKKMRSELSSHLWFNKSSGESSSKREANGCVMEKASRFLVHTSVVSHTASELAPFSGLAPCTHTPVRLNTMRLHTRLLIQNCSDSFSLVFFFNSHTILFTSCGSLACFAQIHTVFCMLIGHCMMRSGNLILLRLQAHYWCNVQSTLFGIVQGSPISFRRATILYWPSLSLSLSELDLKHTPVLCSMSLIQFWLSKK